jgi:hypothetical protein
MAAGNSDQILERYSLGTDRRLHRVGAPVAESPWSDPARRNRRDFDFWTAINMLFGDSETWANGVSNLIQRIFPETDQIGFRSIGNDASGDFMVSITGVTVRVPDGGYLTDDSLANGRHYQVDYGWAKTYMYRVPTSYIGPGAPDRNPGHAIDGTAYKKTRR